MSQTPESPIDQPTPPTSSANPSNVQANPYSDGQAGADEAQIVGGELYPSYNDGGDGTGGLIPYKNPKALLAYYFGVFSLIPVLGIPLGITAFVLDHRGYHCHLPVHSQH
jgi:hypothetical protein